MLTRVMQGVVRSGINMLQEIADRMLLTKGEVADQLRVSKRTVEVWMREGRLPYMRISPRVVRFRWGDVRVKLGEYESGGKGK
jgi:excisionase family DNA binding protein